MANDSTTSRRGINPPPRSHRLCLKSESAAQCPVGHDCTRIHKDQAAAMPCLFELKPGGCRRGAQCMFRHRDQNDNAMLEAFKRLTALSSRTDVWSVSPRTDRTPPEMTERIVLGSFSLVKNDWTHILTPGFLPSFTPCPKKLILNGDYTESTTDSVSRQYPYFCPLVEVLKLAGHEAQLRTAHLVTSAGCLSKLFQTCSGAIGSNVHFDVDVFGGTVYLALHRDIGEVKPRILRAGRSIGFKRACSGGGSEYRRLTSCLFGGLRMLVQTPIDATLMESTTSASAEIGDRSPSDLASSGPIRISNRGSHRVDPAYDVHIRARDVRNPDEEDIRRDLWLYNIKHLYVGRYQRDGSFNRVASVRVMSEEVKAWTHRHAEEIEIFSALLAEVYDRAVASTTHISSRLQLVSSGTERTHYQLRLSQREYSLT